MKNKLTKEEQLLNKKLESVEFDYQDAHWAEMQDLLGKKSFFSNYSTLIKAAAVVITTGSLIYWLNTENKEHIQENNQIVTEQNINENQVSQETKEINPSNISTTSNMKKDISVEENTSSIDQPIEDVSSTWLDRTISDLNQDIPKKEIGQEEANSINEEASTDEAYPIAIEENENSQTESFSLKELKINGKVCIGESVLVETHTNVGQVNWYINGKEQSNTSDQLEIDIRNNDKIIISAHLIVDNKLVDEKKISIQAPYIPFVDFTYEDNTNVYYDFHAKLKANPSGLSNYKWMVDGQTIGLEGQNISYPFGRKGIYDVTLIHESREGCVSKIEKPVAIEQDFKVFVNAFSPNGDGDNDVFIPKMFEIVEGEFQMTIFDRNGNLLYHTNSYSSPWNGRRNNTGELMPTGTYIMKVKIQNKEGIVRNFTERFKLVEF